MERSIIHADMDAFYASVEQLDNPELNGKPVIVGGSPESRGVVSAASYEARKFGVHSAMPTAHAKRLCPDGVFLPVRMGRYHEVSIQIRKILQSFTPLVEPLALDEAFLDVGGSQRLFGTAEEIGKDIKSRILDETGLVVSIGIGPNKFLAKFASDYDKPDGFCVIREKDKLTFLEPLEIRSLWGVGAATARVFAELGIKTVGQLRKTSLPVLRQKLGKNADFLQQLSHGEDHRDVVPDSDAKSIGSESTYPVDVIDLETLETTIWHHAEDVAGRLRSSDMEGRTVHLKVRLSDLSLTTRSETLVEPTSRTDLVASIAARLLRGHSKLKDRPIRLIGVSVSQLTSHPKPQLQLFGDERDEKMRAVDQTIDTIRERMGDALIKRGRLVEKPQESGDRE